MHLFLAKNQDAGFVKHTLVPELFGAKCVSNHLTRAQKRMVSYIVALSGDTVFNLFPFLLVV